MTRKEAQAIIDRDYPGHIVAPDFESSNDDNDDDKVGCIAVPLVYFTTPGRYETKLVFITNGRVSGYQG